jgi:hypothetical protein
MIKKFLVEVFVDVEIKNSKLHKVLNDYRSSINSEATLDDVFKQIAYNEVNGGGFCEGVGEPNEDFIIADFTIDSVEDITGEE